MNSKVSLISQLKSDSKRIVFPYAPKDFHCDAAFACLKAYLEEDTEKYRTGIRKMFTWSNAIQETAYWVKRYHDMRCFTPYDYLLIQHWINESSNKS